MRLLSKDVQAIIIDYQEKLVPVMEEKERLLTQSVKLIKGLNQLDIPMLVTQQYTKGLGDTVAEIKEAVQGDKKTWTYFDKITFSCLQDKVIAAALDSNNRTCVLLCGIEAHICLMQTAIDLRERGYEVVVVVDCVDSRKKIDKEIGLERLRMEGCIFATVESILFELQLTAKSPSFRSISNLIK
ncbi:MAG: isochorismatase family protein [Lachnospiraceae bacterium]